MSLSAHKRWRRILKRAGEASTIVELLVKVALIVGGIAAAAQYFEVKREKRVERTLAYTARFEADPQRSAQQTLTAIFRDQHQTAANLSRAGIDEEGAAEEEARFVEYLRSEANGTGVEREIDSIVSFMDDVNNCFAEHLCDEKVVQTHFGPFADQFEKNLRNYIAIIRRSGTPRYAIGVQEIAELHRTAQSK